MSENGRVEILGATKGELHPCAEPSGWVEFSITLDFFITSDDPKVWERERERVWEMLPDLVATKLEETREPVQTSDV
jgi:hypothetical protein